MARFIYREKSQTAEQLRATILQGQDTLGAKLAAAEAQLQELKLLLKETQNQTAQVKSASYSRGRFMSQHQGFKLTA